MALEDVIRYEKAGVAGDVLNENPETAISLMNSFYNDLIKEFRESGDDKKKDKIQKDLEIGLVYPLTLESKTLPKIADIFSGRFKEAEEDTSFTDLFNYYAREGINKLDKEKKDKLKEKIAKYDNVNFKAFNARASAIKAIKQLKDTGNSEYNFPDDLVKKQEEESKEYAEQLSYLNEFKKLRFNDLLRESIPSSEEQKERILNEYLKE
jgi:hypothetical protein